MRHFRLYRCVSLLVLARMLLASGSDPGTAVPHAPAADQLVIRLQPSSNVCPTQELRLPLTAASVMLRPAMFNNWQEVFQQYPDTLDYLLTPGDYSSWGPLRLVNRSGIPTRKRTIRYYDPETDHLHPVHREKEARIDGIDAWGTTSHWLFHGLTIRTPSTVTKLYSGASHLTFDSFLIEASRIYGMRIRSTQYVCVQNSVIRNAPLVARQDSTGIQIKPDDEPIVGTKIVDNEIYDYGDAIQITAAADLWIPVENTLIENNDLYLTDDRRRPDGTACAENGIDIKAGSDTSLTKILGNRLWGFRRTDTDCAGSGSIGDAIVLHVAARNIKIENNIIGEAPVGIKEKYFPVGWPTSLSRRVKINWNYLYNIQKYHPLDAGAAFDLAGDVRVVSNVMAQGDYVCDQGPDSGYRPADPTFSGNLRVAVEVRDPAAVDRYPCPYDASVNWTRDENAAKTYLYERKRWTGPEFHAVARGY